MPDVDLYALPCFESRVLDPSFFKLHPWVHERPEFDEHYDIDRHPLWSRTNRPVPFTQIGYYQCDQIGTPQEVPDERGEIAWSARYRAWGEAKEVISEAARKAGIRNPIRFQGQYFDHETGLHYNRHRYYDPSSGRFVSKDPIGLAGGINVFQYAPNPVQWIDPLGLAKYYRGAKAGSKPSFEPRPGEYKVRDGNVQPTHGVSVFDNPESCSCRGFVPHEVDFESVSEDLKIIQRGKDPAHFEIMPANPMAEGGYKSALGKIKVK
ncbi:Rhs family protein [Burkholderia lata]|uniref:Rhs family protein n=1 Tax=Burkholderia lata (strain ATCC 17760 / DSM 23089 / LMG 22485 / NCIMB 9086 / R18194 / 383) TaxID=482957 RepID=A0A6P2Y9M6_BURL3|nr:Rhs family protein [Burkholderia lata]